MRDQGTTVILVSHSMEDIARLSDRVWCSAKGGCPDGHAAEVFADEARLKAAGLACRAQPLSCASCIGCSGLSDACYTVESAAQELIRAACRRRSRRMSGAVSLGRYYPASSLLHRLDPRTKILSAILLMVVIFLTRDLVPMLLLGGLTLGLIGLSRVPVREVLLSLRPMLFILLFAVVINMLTIGGDPLLQLGPVVVSRQGVVTAARMGGRLVLLILNTTLLLTLTTTRFILRMPGKSAWPLRKIGFPAHEMAMSDVHRSAICAYTAR
jgi:hypothetical protein